MGKGRLEAFSDGVIAIIITIMVLGLEVPHEDTLAALEHMAPVLPFVSHWMGASAFATAPVSVYGVVLFMCAVAYVLLVHRLANRRGGNRRLALAIGADRKGWISLLLYACGIALGCVQAWMGLAVYVIVALIWFMPDRRIERRVTEA